jgi:hypothetical protein
MKTLAEQLREFMDRVLEAPVRKNYDLEVTIMVPFPENGTPEEQDAWVEEIDVGVDYEISGSYRSGRVGHPDNWTPDDHPELDEVTVYDLASGEDITDKMDEKQMAQITDKVWDHSNSQDNSDDYDGSDDYDYR